MDFQEYQEIRNTIKNVDILMYQGTSLISRIIRKLTRSEYSHAGIVAWWNERLMVMEAVGKGVIVTPISNNIKNYKGKIHLYSAKIPISPDERLKMLQFAQLELGKEYATWKLILFGLKIIFKEDIDKRDELKRENKLYCSHYVAQIYNSGGHDLKKGVSDRFMRPEDIAKSELLEMIK